MEYSEKLTTGGALAAQACSLYGVYDSQTRFAFRLGKV